jgi:hypothetical protein
MSVVGPQRPGVAADRAEFPTFELEWAVDDADDPGEVTVFSDCEKDALAVTWLTMDADHAVPLDETR